MLFFYIPIFSTAIFSLLFFYPFFSGILSWDYLILDFKGNLWLLGIDLIEINRLEKILKKHANFLEKVFGDAEFLQIKKKGFPVQSIAGNFCAKEAFLKAIGTGIGEGINLKDVEILRNEKNAPYIKLKKDNPVLRRYKNVKFSVSIAHTKKYATAVVSG